LRNGHCSGPRGHQYLPEDADRRTSQTEITKALDAYSLLYRLIAASPDVFAMVPISRLDNTLTRVFHDGLLAAPHNGTRILTSDYDPGGDPAYNARIIRAGAEVRTHAALPMWLAIVDQKTVIVPRDPDDADAGLVLVRRRGYVRTAVWMFAQAWRTASPLPRASGPVSLSRWERRVLEQLASGIKDEAAARKLGVSVRTYRRYVTELCEHLGASSRFEAGIRAARAGLV
jgi:DNA-binding CsgD family transcriptional regulator